MDDSDFNRRSSESVMKTCEIDGVGVSLEVDGRSENKNYCGPKLEFSEIEGERGKERKEKGRGAEKRIRKTRTSDRLERTPSTSTTRPDDSTR